MSKYMTPKSGHNYFLNWMVVTHNYRNTRFVGHHTKGIFAFVAPDLPG